MPFSAGKQILKRLRAVADDLGLPLNDDGTVTLYHHTSKDSADRIRREGILRSSAEPDVYATTRKVPDTGYGDEAVEIRVDPRKLKLDDEFPGGRRDFRFPSNTQVGTSPKKSNARKGGQMASVAAGGIGATVLSDGVSASEGRNLFQPDTGRNLFSPEPAPQPVETERSPLAPVYETAGAINRGVAGIPDFFIDAGNAALDLAGVDARIPRAGDALEAATGGTRNFMEPGLARDVIQASGEMAPAVVSVAGAAKGIPSLFSRQSPVRQSVAELAQGGSRQAKDLVQRIQQQAGDVATAKTMISESGRIVRDSLARNAVKQGFDEGVVAAIKASSGSTRERMRTMVDTLERGRSNRRYGVVNRPTDVVGDSISQRIVTIKNANSKAGKDLEREAKGLVGKSADVRPAVDEFANTLEDLGVSLDENLKPVFEGSDLEGIPGAEKAIKNVLKRINLMGNDAYEAHRLKRYIDEQVTYGKSAEGLSGRAERALKSLRRSVDQQLDSVFDGYKKANDTYSETRQALDAFQDVAGKKIDLTGPNAEKAIGTLSRRLMSNVQSRVAMLNSLDELDTVAAKYGQKAEDDVLALALLADELDAVFKPAARTSLGGELAKTAATEGKSGLVRKGAEKTVDLVRGVNEENALKAIKELLSR